MKDLLKDLFDAFTDWLERLLPEPPREPVPVPIPVDVPHRKR
jgi:hypothetical protein